MRHSLLGIILWAAASHLSSPLAAQEAVDPYLAAAFDALEAQDYELGLELIQKASERSTDPRITYYEAFANEKIGNCKAARRGYERAAKTGPERFRQAGAGALEGFATRCVPKAPPKSAEQLPVRTSLRRSPTAVTLGWVAMTVGGMTLLAIPVKHAFEREVANRTEDYFFQVYGCDVEFGEIGAQCDEAEIKANEEWSTYERRVKTAKQSTVWMAVGGATVMAAGLTAVILGSQRVEMAVLPSTDGVFATAKLRF